MVDCEPCSRVHNYRANTGQSMASARARKGRCSGKGPLYPDRLNRTKNTKRAPPESGAALLHEALGGSPVSVVARVQFVAFGDDRCFGLSEVIKQAHVDVPHIVPNSCSPLALGDVPINAPDAGLTDPGGAAPMLTILLPSCRPKVVWADA